MLVPAPDEVDDLQAIGVGELGLRPAIAGDDVAVQFYGDAVGFHAELFNERGEGEWAVEVARVSVDVEEH